MEKKKRPGASQEKQHYYQNYRQIFCVKNTQVNDGAVIDTSKFTMILNVVQVSSCLLINLRDNIN